MSGRPRVHGSRTSYVRGCRCVACRRANADYQRKRYVAGPGAEGKRRRTRSKRYWNDLSVHLIQYHRLRLAGDETLDELQEAHMHLHEEIPAAIAAEGF